jgi:DNA mismatch repair ATPase MutS
MEGKSTFFIEMEETNNAMKLASKHSLIIMVKFLKNKKILI